MQTTEEFLRTGWGGRWRGGACLLCSCPTEPGTPILARAADLAAPAAEENLETHRYGAHGAGSDSWPALRDFGPTDHGGYQKARSALTDEPLLSHGGASARGGELAPSAQPCSWLKIPRVRKTDGEAITRSTVYGFRPP
jgi:hypothetical protein